MRFWDTSALIPLAVKQPSSVYAERWFAQAPQIVVWTLTSIESTSAVQRLVREGTLDAARADAAELSLSTLWAAAIRIIDVEAVKTHAALLLRRHPLRAADAMQLGAALLWAEGDPTGRVFHALDARLCHAARGEGFSVPTAAT